MKNIKYLNAGAGSGKTYFLTSTLADLVLSKKCTPSEVIMTTFSEKAAADIKRNARTRFLEKKDYEAAAGLDAANIGTVHAIAYKYIQKYWYLLGISAGCEVMTDDNKAAYIALTLGRETKPADIDFFRGFVETVGLMQSQSSRPDYGFWKDAVADIISKADSMGVGGLAESRRKSLELIDMCCATHPDYGKIRECAERIFDIADRWRTRFETFKKDNSIIEYNDMENYFLAMLKEKKYAVVQEDIRQSIKYVFVDEFQDSNPKQLEIFDRLSELVVQSYWVGDPKQAIYGFRGSDTDLVEALTRYIRGREKKGKPGFKTGRLDVSRRSLKPLVDFTNDVFVRVFDDLDKDDVILHPTYRTESLPGDVPNLQHWVGVTQPGKILKSGKTGTPKVANKAQTITDMASEVRRILDGRSDIRQVFDKDTRELRDIKASDIAVLCRTNSDVNAVAAEFRKYSIPVVVSSTAEAGRLEIRLVLLMLNYILGDSKLLTAELARLCCGLSLDDILGKEYSELEDLTAFLKKYREELSGKGVASIVRGLVIRMNLLDRCAKWGEGEVRKDNLMALVQNARDYEDSCLTLGESATLEGFISRIQNGKITVDGYASEGVNILTYHGSKGLQWPLVIMFSLSSNSLTDKQVAKSFLWDVNAVRKGVPSESDLYPGYYITYVPRLSNQYNSPLPEEMDTEIKKLTGPGDYQSFRDAQVKEGRRLLYVGVTRARDILVEVGQHDNKQVKGLQMLTDTLGVMNDPGWAAKTDPGMHSDTWQEIWGPGTPKFFYREIDEEDPPVDSEGASYRYAEEVEPDVETRRKRISPSGIEDEALVGEVKVRCLNDEEGPFPQLIVTGAGSAGDDVVGTCIHNIFAVCDPGAQRDVMAKAAEGTIARHGLDGVLNSPEVVVTSAEILFKFLEETYGKAVRVEHELPFRELRDGQMTVGSIDLVWLTSEKECVLVDFKNLPGAGRNVLNSDDSRYLGHYAPQQAAYRDALERGGYTVRACLLYLAMQGRVVELDLGKAK